ncbi:MAG: galactofuranose ABC transporter, permease protein YjfF [Pseudonocardiales bacterium]
MITTPGDVVEQKSAARPGSAFRVRPQHMSVLATLVLLVIMFGWGAQRYNHFGSTQVVANLFISNAALLVVAVGMTFVILTGGIDLSVGAVVALTSLLLASMTENLHWPAFVAIPLVLLFGALLGALMGAIIHFFEIQPFIVTLAGMFFARGLSTVISTDRIAIRNKFLVRMGESKIHLARGTHVAPSVIIAVVVVAVAAYILYATRFGRTVYAVGGSEDSAVLMGLPVARTRILVYTVSGFCSALGGLLFALNLLSGNPLHGQGLELDAIAAVVIGGALLTGGVGYVFGTVLGVLVVGLISTLIQFDGTLSSWWSRIVVGGLLLVFILLQRAVTAAGRRR